MSLSSKKKKQITSAKIHIKSKRKKKIFFWNSCRLIKRNNFKMQRKFLLNCHRNFNSFSLILCLSLAYSIVVNNSSCRVIFLLQCSIIPLFFLIFFLKKSILRVSYRAINVTAKNLMKDTFNKFEFFF